MFGYFCYYEKELSPPPTQMNDKIKAKLKSGEYILKKKRHAKSEVRKSFREIQDAGSMSNIRVRVGKHR
jgi:hypothetical protein